MQFLKPDRFGRTRAIIVTILSGTLLWVDLGIHHTPPEEFTPEAAIAMLMAMFLLPSLLLTGFTKGYCADSTIVAGIAKCYSNYLHHDVDPPLLHGLFFPISTTNEIAGFHADAGVILGAAVWHGNGLGERPSPALRERIDLGHELLMNHAIRAPYCNRRQCLW